ncbi:hypothetical protein PIROE2DRAFT_11456 [Piromyces sp. E2]|nr:hypothetical protein PIROE2DRAFT_11456 [Piromyces sp. E2]|eukprot:OUM62303.1 hypothetical protein PIROE2DRAFT_11456 [Piromyces sp. E2]
MIGHYYKDQFYKELNDSPREIAIVDSSYVFNARTTLTLEVNQSVKKEFDFFIRGSDNMVYFKGQKSMTTLKLYNQEDFTVMKSSYGLTKSTLYAGHGDKHEVGTISHKNSLKGNKFCVDVTNLATEQTEYLDLNCEPYYRTGCLFLGREDDGAPMLCKIYRLPKKGFTSSVKYKIEIAKNIDHALVILLALFVVQSALDAEARARQRRRR